VDHLAVTLDDYFGNPIGRFDLVFPESGTDAGRAAVVVGDAVRALCLLARSRGFGIAMEDLDFSRMKAGLREYGAAHARRLSGWSYAKFFQVLVEDRISLPGGGVALVGSQPKAERETNLKEWMAGGSIACRIGSVGNQGDGHARGHSWRRRRIDARIPSDQD
jgi:hypothetical protein